MHILLAKKQLIPSFILAISTLFFTSLSLSYSPGLNYIPSRDNAGTGGIDESQQGCVYRESDASGGRWTVDDCDYVGAHYACYNGTEWQISQALGSATNPGEPRDGNVGSQIKSVDLWDPVKADNLCKSNFGPSYFFSVPVNPQEDEKLGEAITGMIAAKKRTWLYYYSNTENIALSANYWLGNRTEYTNLLTSNLGNAGDLGIGGVADCTLIDRATGLWQDAPCSEKHSFACYDSGAWLITKTQESWKSGFSSCETEYGLQTLYAVPRDVGENSAIAAAALPSGGTGIAADYNKVWLNRSDLAYEEFFISNQTRQAWWAVGQPTNRGNADCTLVDSSGNWIAESCNGAVAYHACYLGNNQWQLTSDIPDLKRSESALGFGLCKRLADNAEYRPPNTAISNNVLAGLVDTLPSNKFVWVNYSDQNSEGYWKEESPFLDFVSIDGILAGESQDCGYFSLETDNKRNWLAGQCYAGGAPLQQGFACTNGYEWKIATEAQTGGASLVSDLWKDGFTACEAAFGKDYEFAAPYDADQNSRLALALRLSGTTRAWMNLNDAKSEGEWVANGPVVNLSPVITSLTPQREVSEKQALNLSVTASDPETGNDVGLTYQWSIIGERVGLNNTGTDTVVTPVLVNANTPTVTIPAVDLINDDYYLDLQLQITDADVDSPATTTKVITIKIISPLRAAYDFNNFTNPALDISGNGHDLILDPSQVGIQAHDVGSGDYFAKLGSGDSFSIVGTGPNGLIVGDTNDEYTVMFRFKMDELPADAFATFLQKGAAGSRQPGIFFNKAGSNINYTNSTTSGQNASSAVSNEEVRLDQWMTVAYVKTPTDMIFYIDKAEANLDPAPWNTVPDSSSVLNGTSVDFSAGNWHFGNSPFTSEGITGGLDDIRVYSRALTAAELTTIFPDQPRGVFNFVNSQEAGDENEVPAAVDELLIPISRTQGDDGEVSVGFKLVSDSAILDTDFRLKDDLEVLGSPDRGKGTLTWAVHDATDKNIIVELLGDNIREGTETFNIELVRLGNTEPDLGGNNIINANIVDKTPNPYGAIGIAPTTALENIAVDEGQSGIVTVERVGSDSLGAFDVTYEIEALTADSTSDFTITQAGFTPSGNSGTNAIIGGGRLSFPDNASGTPVTRQVQTISFDAIADTELEFDESFIVRLLQVTDSGQTTLADPSTSAILGTMNTHTQVINDISPGRVSFAQASIAVDEVDQGAGSNSVLVVLERLGGGDGAMCVTLNLETSSTASSNDYTITYLSASASGQEDVYWTDQGSGAGLVQITAVNDEVFDPNEFIELSWARKANCNGEVTATPYAAEVTDNETTQITINDFTTAIKLKFTETNYSVSELTSTKTITIQATQSRQVGNESEGDFANRINNNGFEVSLTRVETSAIEGTHFGDLTSQELLTFAPGETEKTITVPIVDNCLATQSLTVGLGLDIPGSNTLPVSLIDVSSASSGLAITNASESIIFTGISPDFAGVAARISPNWKGDGKLYVTGQVDAADLNPEFTEMALSAGVTHNCLSTLQFNWSLATGNTPLPLGNGLPANFSMLPSLVNSSSLKTLTEKFNLPFVIKDTDLVVSLSITDPETGVTYTKNTPGFAGLENALTVSQNFRTIENNGEGGNNCVDWEGVGERVKNKSCDTIDRQNGLAYHPITQQLVFGQESGGLSCISHSGGDEWLFAEYCGTAIGQRWAVAADRVNSLDNNKFFIEYGVGSNKGPYADDSGGTAGAKRWTWLNLQGTYLP